MSATITHGLTRRLYKSPEYSVWSTMKHRVTNPKRKDYKHYGGRGIKICQRWMNPALFIEDMGKRPSPNHKLERIDNNGDYCPENCIWATQKHQCNNKRTCHYIEFRGEKLSMQQWSERLGLKRGTIKHRLKAGWSAEDALSVTSVGFNNKRPKHIFIAIIPCDYSSADVEVFDTRDEAEDYIHQNAIRGETHYCQVLERTIHF